MRESYITDSIDATGYQQRSDNKQHHAPFSIGQVREREIMKTISHVFGGALPDDDDGRAALREVLNQQALNGVSPDELREHGLDLLPEAGDDDTLFNMVKEIGAGRKRRADDVARALGVDYELRTLLDHRTIGACDMSKAERKAIAAQNQAAKKRWDRQKAGAKPQAKSERRNKPWERQGISRTEYYARKKAAAGLLRQPYSSLISLPKQSRPEEEDCRCAPPLPPVAVCVLDAPADPGTPSHCQASSFDQQQERETVVSEMPAVHAAELIPAASRLRQAHIERNQLLKLDPLDAEQGRRLAEFNRIIETARHELEQRPRREATDFACTDLNRVRYAKFKIFAASAMSASDRITDSTRTSRDVRKVLPISDIDSSVSGDRKLKESTPRLAPGRPQPPAMGFDNRTADR